MFSLTGADATDFEVAKNGDITSRDIMNFEVKAQYNFNLCLHKRVIILHRDYSMLNVINSTADDGNHIANVDISSQAGALEAISIWILR